MADITPEIIAEHGLKPDEYERILNALGRAPNMVELGIFSVMWSEHCSYKSSRLHLKKLPTTGKQVICGPGENAGVVDIGEDDDGNKLAAIFKMESHNHPSYIEPYQGAATGVGGILRDVFTMGARPVALMNALRFGHPNHPKMKHLVKGVVAGIGGYGNCVGVPTVGGETNFDPAYDNNILVNAMAVGLADQEKIFYSAASGAGNPIVYVGSKTGRDGIHGATMASAEFDEDSEEKRPTVQVGDPFTEKLLIEACLELMSSDAIVAIQDMGAAGLTSSSVEMASKGGVGIHLNLDHVPQRETEMTAYEMMLSESQERMLMVLKPGREGEAEAIFRKWELDFAVIGEVTETGRMVLSHGGETVCDIPLAPLADDAPLYDRPYEHKAALAPYSPSVTSDDVRRDFLTMLASPQLASRRWIWEQYDHMVMADTAQYPGGDAAVVRIHGTGTAEGKTARGLAITTDCTPRYCHAQPFEGGKQAIAECYRNLVATGATPLATTDCMNFANPERPHIMAQFVGTIEGMAEACSALDMPIVSGNVSLYNETTLPNGKIASILPTPAIGAIGVINDLDRMRTMAFQAEGEDIWLIGEDSDYLGQSLWLSICHGISGDDAGAPPPVDLEAERNAGVAILQLIKDGALSAVHDISDGGAAIALAEMAMAGNIGATITGFGTEATAFSEGQARYIATAPKDKAILIENFSVPARKIGETGGDSLKLGELDAISLDELNATHQKFFTEWMG